MNVEKRSGVWHGARTEMVAVLDMRGASRRVESTDGDLYMGKVERLMQVYAV